MSDQRDQDCIAAATDAVTITLDNEKLGELLDHLDAVHGPVPDEALDRAEQDWPTTSEEQP